MTTEINDQEKRDREAAENERLRLENALQKKSLAFLSTELGKIEEEFFGYEEKCKLAEWITGLRHHIYGTWIGIDEALAGPGKEGGE